MATQIIDPGQQTPPYKYTLVERLKKGDEVTHLITLAAAFSIILITVLLVWQLWSGSKLPRHEFGWHFFETSKWDPVSGDFGALPFIYGTVLTSAIGLLIAVPMGIFAAIFLAELAPRRISNLLTFLIELLAAVPSVIFGLIGIFVLIPILSTVVVPLLKKVLGFLPIFSRSILWRELFLSRRHFVLDDCALHRFYLPGGIACRASVAKRGDVSTWRYKMGRHLACGPPLCETRHMGSIFLALARALGETMAVTMVIGNVPQIKASLLAPGYTIAAVIANEFTEATGDLYLAGFDRTWAGPFLVTMIINALARVLMLTMGSHEVSE